MSEHFKNLYDDGNIPHVDLPKNEGNLSVPAKSSISGNVLKSDSNVKPLPESFRPRKDGPGGD